MPNKGGSTSSPSYTQAWGTREGLVSRGKAYHETSGGKQDIHLLSFHFPLICHYATLSVILATIPQVVWGVPTQTRRRMMKLSILLAAAGELITAGRGVPTGVNEISVSTAQH